MTHEHTHGTEEGGPEHDENLPDARSIPEFDNVFDSLAPPLAEDPFEGTPVYIDLNDYWER